MKHVRLPNGLEVAAMNGIEADARFRMSGTIRGNEFKVIKMA